MCSSVYNTGALGKYILFTYMQICITTYRCNFYLCDLKIMSISSNRLDAQSMEAQYLAGRRFITTTTIQAPRSAQHLQSIYKRKQFLKYKQYGYNIQNGMNTNQTVHSSTLRPMSIHHTLYIGRPLHTTEYTMNTTKIKNTELYLSLIHI